MREEALFAGPVRSRSYVTLDGLRGIAALSVVVLHCHRLIGDLSWSSAALAVDLFFVLSGFVLAHAYSQRLAENLSVAEFMKARVIRLYPLYLAGIALGIVEALLVIHYQQGSIPWDWWKFWTALPFNLFMIPTPWALYPFNGVMWSIFLELVVNLLWALSFPFLRTNRALIATVVVAAIGLVASVLIYGKLTSLGTSWGTMPGGLFRVCFPFFLGVLIYRFRDHAPKIPAIILLVALPAILFLPLPVLAQLFAALFILPALVWLGSAVEPRGWLGFVSHKLGAASYAVYAVHKRLYALTYAAGLKLGFDLQPFAPWVGIVFIAGLIPFCLFLDGVYDRRARKWLAGMLARRPKDVEREGVTQAP